MVTLLDRGSQNDLDALTKESVVAPRIFCISAMPKVKPRKRVVGLSECLRY